MSEQQKENLFQPSESDIQNMNQFQEELLKFTLPTYLLSIGSVFALSRCIYLIFSIFTSDSTFWKNLGRGTRWTGYFLIPSLTTVGSVYYVANRYINRVLGDKDSAMKDYFMEYFDIEQD